MKYYRYRVYMRWPIEGHPENILVSTISTMFDITEMASRLLERGLMGRFEEHETWVPPTSILRVEFLDSYVAGEMPVKDDRL